jgi:hypothetical protein
VEAVAGKDVKQILEASARSETNNRGVWSSPGGGDVVSGQPRAAPPTVERDDAVVAVKAGVRHKARSHPLVNCPIAVLPPWLSGRLADKVHSQHEAAHLQRVVVVPDGGDTTIVDLEEKHILLLIGVAVRRSAAHQVLQNDPIAVGK